MHLTQPAAECKQLRFPCDTEIHDRILKSHALFVTFTSPAGYRDDRDTNQGICELGLCRTCGHPLARKLTPDEEAIWLLATGRGGSR